MSHMSQDYLPIEMRRYPKLGWRGGLLIGVALLLSCFVAYGVLAFGERIDPRNDWAAEVCIVIGIANFCLILAERKAR
jgi:hypothetical protein